MPGSGKSCPRHFGTALVITGHDEVHHQNDYNRFCSCLCMEKQSEAGQNSLPQIVDNLKSYKDWQSKK